jgi:hypothetical protein
LRQEIQEENTKIYSNSNRRNNQQLTNTNQINMGIWHSITHGLSAGERRAEEAAKRAAEEAKERAEEAARAAAAAKAAAEKLAEEKAAEAAAVAKKKAEELKEAAAKAAREAAAKTGNSFIHAVNVASKASVAAWTEGSGEAKDLSSAVEKGGITIGTGFIAGATVVGKGIEKGGEEYEKGLVALGDYLTEHLCDIALGSALSAAFATLAADGEEETTVGELATLAATNFEDQVVLNTTAKSLAFIIAQPVYEIPDVSKAVRSKSNLEAIIAFLIVKSCQENPEMVVGSGGQFIAGVLIFGITSLVCEGTIPGGFRAWKGTQ